MKKLLFILSLFFPFSAISNKLTIYVWDANGEDSYGHVSLKFKSRQGQDHYVSLWPDDPDEWDSEPHTQENPRGARIEENDFFKIFKANPNNLNNPNQIDRIDLKTQCGMACIKAKAVYEGRNYTTDVEDEGRIANSIYHIDVSSNQKDAIEDEWNRIKSNQLIWFAPGMSIEGDEQELTRLGSLANSLQDVCNNPQAFNCASLTYYLLRIGDLHLKDYNFIHNPLVQAGIFTLITQKSLNIDIPVEKQFLQHIAFFEKFIYPAKLSYLAKVKMVNTIKTISNYPEVSLNDSQVNDIYDLMKSDTVEEYNQRLNDNMVKVRQYLKPIWDSSFSGKKSRKWGKS